MDFTCFSANLGRQRLPRFSGILPRYLEILFGFSSNQYIWGCACTPASYTTVWKCQLFHFQTYMLILSNSKELFVFQKKLEVLCLFYLLYKNLFKCLYQKFVY